MDSYKFCESNVFKTIELSISKKLIEGQIIISAEKVTLGKLPRLLDVNSHCSSVPVIRKKSHLCVIFLTYNFTNFIS